MTPETKILTRLAVERTRWERDVRVARLDSMNAWNLWDQTGKSNNDYLRKFFEKHYYVIELSTRIEWIDKFLEEFL